MKVMITGHRIEKIVQYGIGYIPLAITDALHECYSVGATYGLSGMASGCDLWFCESCLELKIPYAACIPFDNQEEYVVPESRHIRRDLIKKAAAQYNVRNTYMVEQCDMAIVVWDGNKGGTHNCLQQLIEKKKDFIWINPVKEQMVYWC